MRATVDRPGLDSQGRSPLIKIRRVRKGDLSKVRDVIEQAFGDFFERQVGTRPRQVFGGAQYVHHRWLMEPWGCFVAEEGDGKIVGAAVAVMWGTLGLVGPIAVLTNYQNQDIGQQLLARVPGVLRREQGDAPGRLHVRLQPPAPRALPEVRVQAEGPRGDHRQAPGPARGRQRGGQAREARPRRAPLLLAGRGEEEARDAEDPPHHQCDLARAWTWPRRSRSSMGSPSATRCSSRRGAR